MKKTLSVILAVIMAVCCLPFAAIAEEPPTEFTKSASFEAPISSNRGRYTALSAALK